MTRPQRPTSWTEQSETGTIDAWTTGSPPPPPAPRRAAPVRAAAVAPPQLDPTGEPVVIAHAVTVILGALVTAGWVAIPNTVIDTIGTVLALVLSTVGAIIARSQVSPVKGGIWQAIGGYVADLVAAELAKYDQEFEQYVQGQ